MRVLVCGGRDFFDSAGLSAVLDQMHASRPFKVLIHGAAIGADTLAGEWAKARGVTVEAYPARWDLHGRSAGPIRNRRMLRKGKPDVVIAFPGGDGTADMVRQAKAAGVPGVVLKVERR